MAKKKRDDDNKKDDDKEEEEEESKTKSGEEAAINSDVLEESLEEAPIADPADDDLFGTGTFHVTSLEDDPEEEAPDFEDMN